MDDKPIIGSFTDPISGISSSQPKAHLAVNRTRSNKKTSAARVMTLEEVAEECGKHLASLFMQNQPDIKTLLKSKELAAFKRWLKKHKQQKGVAMLKDGKYYTVEYNPDSDKTSLSPFTRNLIPTNNQEDALEDWQTLD